MLLLSGWDSAFLKQYLLHVPFKKKYLRFLCNDGNHLSASYLGIVHTVLFGNTARNLFSFLKKTERNEIIQYETFKLYYVNENKIKYIISKVPLGIKQILKGATWILINQPLQVAWDMRQGREKFSLWHLWDCCIGGEFLIQKSLTIILFEMTASFKRLWLSKIALFGRLGGSLPGQLEEARFKPGCCHLQIRVIFSFI